MCSSTLCQHPHSPPLRLNSPPVSSVFCNTSEGFPPTERLSRLDVVKALFHSLANRSMAYTYRHVIGLTLFGSEVKRSCDLTELFVNFQVWLCRSPPLFSFHSTCA